MLYSAYFTLYNDRDILKIINSLKDKHVFVAKNEVFFHTLQKNILTNIFFTQ